MTTLTMVSKRTEETMEIAKTLATLLQAGDVITLTGDLGVGKTTFTKGLAEGLEITDRITSPTFTLIKEYEGKLPLYHMDVYRLEHSEEDIGFDDYFYSDGVTVVEWAQFIEDFLPDDYIAITMKRLAETEREIIVKSIGTTYETYITKLKSSSLRRLMK